MPVNPDRPPHRLRPTRPNRWEVGRWLVTKADDTFTLKNRSTNEEQVVADLAAAAAIIEEQDERAVTIEP
jgi:hypothetical protein